MAIGIKTGGRVKGTPNVDRAGLRDMLDKKFPGWCPVEAMAEIAVNKTNEVNIRLQASKEVAQYIYPKLKSVEHKGENGKPISQNIIVKYVTVDKTND